MQQWLSGACPLCMSLAIAQAKDQTIWGFTAWSVNVNSCVAMARLTRPDSHDLVSWWSALLIDYWHRENRIRGLWLSLQALACIASSGLHCKECEGGQSPDTSVPSVLMPSDFWSRDIKLRYDAKVVPWIFSASEYDNDCHPFVHTNNCKLANPLSSNFYGLNLQWWCRQNDNDSWQWDRKHCTFANPLQQIRKQQDQIAGQYLSVTACLKQSSWDSHLP